MVIQLFGGIIFISVWFGYPFVMVWCLEGADGWTGHMEGFLTKTIQEFRVLVDPEVTAIYTLKIMQPSQYRYAKLQYRFAVTSGSLSK